MIYWNLLKISLNVGYVIRMLDSQQMNGLIMTSGRDLILNSRIMKNPNLVVKKDDTEKKLFELLLLYISYIKIL